jgi:hypothetical protein
MKIERPNKMRTRQSLPVSGCDGDGGVGISIREGDSLLWRHEIAIQYAVIGSVETGISLKRDY